MMVDHTSPSGNGATDGHQGQRPPHQCALAAHQRGSTRPTRRGGGGKSLTALSRKPSPHPNTYSRCPGWSRAREMLQFDKEEVMNKPGRKRVAGLAVVPAAIPSLPGRRDLPEAPAHLSIGARQWWQQVVADYDLEPHHLRLLQSAAEAWDRMQQARQALSDHGGLTFTGANGDMKTHPAVAIERDARIAYARLVRELDLDAGAPAESRRPPSLYSNRRD